MALPITEAQRYLGSIRPLNPQLGDISDVELAKLIRQHTGTQDLDAYIDANPLLRGLGRFNTAYQDKVVAPVSNFVGSHLGNFAGDVASNIVGGAPEMLLALAGVGLAPLTGGASLAALPAAVAVGAGRSYADTADPVAAGIGGFSAALGGAGASFGGGLARSALQALAGRSVGPAANVAARTFGSWAGGVAGEIPGQLMAFTGDKDASVMERLQYNLNRLSQPYNLGVELVSGLPYAAMDYIQAKGQVAKERAVDRLNRIPVDTNAFQPAFNDHISAAEFLRSKGLPVSLEENSPTTIQKLATQIFSDPQADLDWAKFTLLQEKNPVNLTTNEAEYLTTMKDRAPQLREAALKRVISPEYIALQSVNDFRRQAPEHYQRLAQLYQSLDINLRKGLANDFDLDPALDGESFALGVMNKLLASPEKIDSLQFMPPDTIPALAHTAKYLREVLAHRPEDGVTKYLRSTEAKLEAALQRYQQQADFLTEFLSHNEASILKADMKNEDQVLPKQAIENKKRLPKDYTKSRKEKADIFDQYFLYPLQRAMKHPVMWPVFDLLRSHRVKIKQGEYDTLAHIGQNADGSLSPDKAYERAVNWLNRSSDDVKQRANKIFAENQKRRKESKPLVSEDEMRTTFGIKSDDDIQIIKNFVELPNKVAYREFKQYEYMDTLALTKVLYLQSKKKLTLDQAKIVAEELVRNSDYHTPSTGKEFSARLAGELIETRFGVKMDEAVLAQLGEIAGQQIENRARFLAAHERAGYAPMTRRGKYFAKLLRAEALSKPVDKEGNPAKYTVEDYYTIDSDNKKDFNKRLAEAEARGDILQGDTIIKGDLSERVHQFEPDEIRALRNSLANKNLELVKTLEHLGADPEIVSVVREWSHSSDPLAAILSEAVQSRSQQFDQYRSGMEGFDINQFLPNLLDYAAVKNSALQKMITRMEVEMDLLRPEWDETQGLRELAQEQTNYALGNDNSKWNKAREMIFYHYLGASFKHIVQNMTQNALTGIGPLVQHTGSYTKANKAFMKGLTTATQWALRKTTGDKNLDYLIKKAERDGITGASITDLFLDHDSITPALGNRFGKIVDPSKKAARNAWRGLKEVLRSTAAFAERANRTWSFLTVAQYELAKRKGKPLMRSDLDRIYQEARKFTDQVNFVGDRANRPGFIMRSAPHTHGAVLTATALQSFALQHLGQIAVLMKKDKKAAAAAISHLVAAGGLFGLPFVRDIDSIIAALTGESMEDSLRDLVIDEEIPESEELADLVVGGLPAWMGIDASRSIALGSILNYNSASSPGENIAETLGGPGASMIGSYIRGFNHILEGDWSTGIRQAAPPPALYWSRLTEALVKNRVFNREGVPNRNPLSAEDMRSLLLGFTPMSVSKERSADFARTRKEANINNYRTKQVDLIAKALRDGKNEEAESRFQQLVTELGPAMTDVDSLITSVTNRYSDLLHGRQAPSLTVREKAFQDEIRKSYPSSVQSVRSPVENVVSRMQVAESTGNPAVLLELLQSFPSHLQKAVQDEIVVRAGVPPELLRMMSSRDINNRQRSMALIESLGGF